MDLNINVINYLGKRNKPKFKFPKKKVTPIKYLNILCDKYDLKQPFYDSIIDILRDLENNYYTPELLNFLIDKYGLPEIIYYKFDIEKICYSWSRRAMYYCVVLNSHYYDFFENMYNFNKIDLSDENVLKIFEKYKISVKHFNGEYKKQIRDMYDKIDQLEYEIEVIARKKDIEESRYFFLKLFKKDYEQYHEPKKNALE